MGEQNKPIIGGIFGTRTEVDAEGNVTHKDDFHLRLYWELFDPEVQKTALKGNSFKVFLFIAMHMDKNGEGWPSQRRIAEKLGINKDTVGKAVDRLEKYGLIETDQDRKPDGTYSNTVYKLRFSPQVVEKEVEEDEKTVSEKTSHGENPHEINDSTVSEKIGDGKTGSGKSGHKKEPLPKEDGDCMNGPFRSSSDQDNFDFEKIDDREKDVLDALYQGAKRFRVDSLGNTAEGYVPDFYLVLQKHFPRKISPDVIKLAFRISRQKMVDMYDGNEVDLKNPPGWFKMAYSDALKAYAGMKYLDDKRKKEEEFERFMAEKEYSFGN